MSKAPFWPVATDALVADTMHLSTEEFGAYVKLMIAQWRSGGNPLPNDDSRLSRMAGLTPRAWQKMRATMSEFFEISDAGWNQKRVEKDFADVIEKIEKNRASGSLGGKSKALKNKNVALANATIPPEKTASETPTNQNYNQNQNYTGETELPETFDMSLPLSDPQGGPDVGGALPETGQEETTVEAGAPSSQPVTASAPAAGPTPDGFERFWKQSEPPKFASKLKARQAWVKTRHVRPADDVLIAAHAAYRASVAAENARRKQERPPRAAQALCHPETFLLDQRWEGFVEAATAAPVTADAGPDWGADGAALAELIGPGAMAGWFADATLDRGAGGAVTITVVKPFAARWIEDKFMGALVRVFGDGVRVEAKPKVLAA